MKKTITLLAILCVVNVFATDRFVNPNLSQGNGTTLFTTITDAVEAAVNGDRIIVASSTYNEAELIIEKSLQIIPQIAGETIGFNSNIIFNGFIGMKVEIIGFDLGNYDFLTNTIDNPTSNTFCYISLLNSQANSLDFNNYNLNMINCVFNNDVSFKNGSIFLSEMNNCYLYDEIGSNTDDTKIKFIRNTISNDLYIFNDNNEVVIANNNLNNLIIQKWDIDLNKTNYIINNEFSDNCKIHFACHEGGIGSNLNSTYSINYNFKVSNNIFIGSLFFTAPNFVNNAPWSRFTYGNDYYDFLPVEQLSYSSSSSIWPNPNFNGFFEWSYNFKNIPGWNGNAGSDTDYNVPRDSGDLSFTDILGSSDIIDSGNPNHFYYDIDLTINDRGINGGPFSALNYNAPNPNNSRAFIFDLDMPVDLFPGQNVEIKAKGYHSN